MRINRVRSIGFWLLGMATATAMLIICGFGNPSGVSVSASIPIELAQQAADLTQQGHQQMSVGNAEAALKIWRDAEEEYDRLSNAEGVTGSRINQSLALQALGQSRHACKVLLTALEIDRPENKPDFCDSSVEEASDFSEFSLSSLHAIGLRNLGNVLRAIGKPEIAKQALEKSLDIARSLNDNSAIDAALLGLGNVEESLYKQRQDLFDRTGSGSQRKKAIEHAKQAVEFYQNLGESERDRANLNRLSLALDAIEWLEDKSNQNREDTIDHINFFKSEIIPLANTLVSESSLFESFTPIEQIYARLTLARNLSKIQSSTNFLSIAFDLANEAKEQAQKLGNNSRIKSETLGTLGYLYEQAKNNQNALDNTQSALSLAQSIHAEDLVSQWAWQSGRIEESEGNIDRAIAAYKVAIKSLDSVREDILAVNPDIQFSFRDNVKPVYEELLNLLLRSPQPSQSELKQAIEVSDGFQTAELENFLRCNLRPKNESNHSASKSVKVLAENQFEPSTAIIRIIVLEQFNRAIEIIQPDANISADLVFHEISDRDWDEAEKNITALRKQLNDKALRDPKVEDSLKLKAQLIYQKLIAPIQSDLPENGTLVFILDSTLQSIPMAMLQDEKGQYLIQRYKIASNLPTQTTNSSVSSQLSRVFAAGLSIQGESSDVELNSWKALENVDDELTAIQESTQDSSILLDRDFTVQNFTQRVEQLSFPIVHIATHGKFSSDPKDTFIVAYDDRINVNQLDEILRDRTEGTRRGIDLLVLSACQTAKDDKRGGLGLAGVSVRAGADSTIASLWNISDRSTAEFMKEFYLALKANVSKAKALRQAQLKFIENPDYNSNNKNYKHPYYWAAFVLIGDSI